MFRPRNRAVGAALLMVVVLILTACSSTGGKKAAEAANAGTGVVAGHASTPHYTIAMITHAGPGQTFWDTERYGGVAAAAKDNFTLKYAGNRREAGPGLRGHDDQALRQRPEPAG
jgi:simple sugar transport system substrate-binding protein